ncbi:MAG: ABC transporter permease [Acidimicrobiales bacterium]
MAEVVLTGEERATTQLRLRLSRFAEDKAAIAGLVVFVLMVAFVVIVPLVSGYSPDAQSLSSAFAGPSTAHLLGTDELGRDTLTRLAVGGRYSLALSAAATALAVVVGVAVGLFSGYRGGQVDYVLQRGVELVIGIPSLVLGLAVVSLINDRNLALVLAAAIVGLPAYVRFARSTAVTIAVQEYVEAARSLGASTCRIMFRHILPNSVGPLVVQVSFGLGQALLLITALGFLGLGVQPPQPEWGEMASAATKYLSTHPILEILPGVAITVVTITTTLVGEGIRSALDPRGRRK